MEMPDVLVRGRVGDAGEEFSLGLFGLSGDFVDRTMGAGFVYWREGTGKGGS